MMDVKDKKVFLTGGAGGIGKATVEAFLNKGAKVMFCDISDKVGSATEKELKKKFGANNVMFVHCDVTDTKHFAAAFAKAITALGRVDIMVNNAGICDENEMDKTIAINVTALMHGTKMAEKHMRKDMGGKGGVIVNIASIVGLYAFAGDIPIYVASKHAVIGYTGSLALSQMECGNTGVRLCCVCPGGMDTQLLKDLVEFLRPETRPLVENPPSPAVIGEAVVKACEDTDNNGGLLEVWSHDICSYRRRLVVDKDGVSNPIWSDEPLLPQITPRRTKKAASSTPTLPTTAATTAPTLHATPTPAVQPTVTPAAYHATQPSAYHTSTPSACPTTAPQKQTTTTTPTHTTKP